MARLKEKEQDILVAATEIFSKKGFHKANISDIADKAGIGKGTIYEYFKSKDELFLSSITFNVEKYFKSLENDLNGCISYMDKINAFISFHQKITCNRIEIGKMMCHSDWMGLKEQTKLDAHSYFMDQRKRAVEMVSGIFETGIAEGKVKEVDRDFVSDIFCDMVMRYCVRMSSLEYTNDDREREREKFIDFFMKGIGV